MPWMDDSVERVKETDSLVSTLVVLSLGALQHRLILSLKSPKNISSHLHHSDYTKQLMYFQNGPSSSLYCKILRIWYFSKSGIVTSAGIPLVVINSLPICSATHIIVTEQVLFTKDSRGKGMTNQNLTILECQTLKLFDTWSQTLKMCVYPWTQFSVISSISLSSIHLSILTATTHISLKASLIRLFFLRLATKYWFHTLSPLLGNLG